MQIEPGIAFEASTDLKTIAEAHFDDLPLTSPASDMDMLTVDPVLTRVPYERDGKTYFLSCWDIAAICAEGHYTVLYGSKEKLFCPWSISTANERLPTPQFQRTHRSYLVNIEHVSCFQRNKDNGTCLFEDVDSLKSVPVSRTRVAALREALGI